MCVTPPLVAVTVRVEVPLEALRFALTVNVEEPEVSMDAGLKLALARRGTPETLKLTVPAKPAPGVMVTVYLALEPRAMVMFDGVTEAEKSGLIVRVTLAVCTSAPLVAVTVSG